MDFLTCNWVASSPGFPQLTVGAGKDPFSLPPFFVLLLPAREAVDEASHTGVCHHDNATLMVVVPNAHPVDDASKCMFTLWLSIIFSPSPSTY